MIGKIILGILAGLLWNGLALAGSITAELDKTVGSTADSFQLTVTISGKADGEPKIPAIDGLQIQKVGESNNTSIVNGTISREVAYTFEVIPDRAGQFTIPSIPLKVDGQPEKTLPLAFTVTGAGTGSEAGQSADVFIKRIIAKSQVYVGEVVKSELKIYHRVGLQDAQLPQENIPHLSRWRVEDQTKSQETIHGQTYQVITLTEYWSFDQAGKITIPSIGIEAVVNDTSRQPRQSRDIFDQFFQQRRGVRKRLRTEPIEVDVKPLPTNGQTRQFTGLVGEFTLDAKTSTSTVAVGDSVDLTLQLSGKGVASGATVQWPQWPSHAKVYDNKPTYIQNVTADGIASERQWKLALVPTQPGPFEIPAIAMQVFNPVTGQYETLQTKPISLNVTGEAQSAPAPAPTSTPPEATEPQAAPSASPAASDVVSAWQSRWLQLRENHALQRQLLWGFIGIVILGIAFILIRMVRARQRQKQAQGPKPQPRHAWKLWQSAVRRLQQQLDQIDPAHWLRQFEDAVAQFLETAGGYPRENLDLARTVRYCADRHPEWFADNDAHQLVSELRRLQFSGTPIRREDCRQLLDLGAASLQRVSTRIQKV